MRRARSGFRPWWRPGGRLELKGGGWGKDGGWDNTRDDGGTVELLKRGADGVLWSFKSHSGRRLGRCMLQMHVGCCIGFVVNTQWPPPRRAPGILAENREVGARLCNLRSCGRACYRETPETAQGDTSASTVDHVPAHRTGVLRSSAFFSCHDRDDPAKARTNR